MLDLSLLNNNVNPFPGLYLSNIVNLLPLFLLASIRVGAFILSAPLFGMQGVPTPVRVVISFILGLAVVSFIGLPPEPGWAPHVHSGHAPMPRCALGARHGGLHCAAVG